jgi:hypothetical protein
VGWLSHVGEFRLFDSEESLRARARSPRCYSGVPRTGVLINLARLDGAKVRVRGVLVDYANLQTEEGDVLTRRMIGGRVVHNFCFGDQIILATSIERVR